MDNEYIEYDKGNKKLIAEKIFINKKPRSRVMLDIVKDIKNNLKRYRFGSDKVLKFSKAERIGGEYFLLTKDENYYPSLIENITSGNIEVDKAADWCLQILQIWNSLNDKIEFSSEIKLNYFRVDHKSNIKLVDPHINRIIEQYRYPYFEKEFDEIYRSPDLISKQNWNEKARIYNFGVIFYYLLTGRFPFQADNKKDMYDKKMTGSFLKARYLNSEISVKFSDLITKMLQSDQKKQPVSINAIINEIKHLKEKKSIKALPQVREQNLNKKETQLRKSRLKENILFYFRHHWGKTLFFGIIITAILSIGLLGTNPPVITEATTPDQLIKYFYDSIDKKNPVILTQTTSVNLKKLKTMVSEGYVMETMRGAYQNQNDEEDIEEKVFGIKSLNINSTAASDYYQYEISYIFYYPREDKMQEKNMMDRLLVKQEDGKWQITEIKGDIVDLIEGNFEG